ncbi:DUF1269 domain-containing protein [Burkholderia sp. R-70199]|nr:DUF1269 domain-containing protein [Burkholderia sp. R-70199]
MHLRRYARFPDPSRRRTEPRGHVDADVGRPDGALRGAFWGSLIGWLFLNPLLGAAVGSASGALAGKLSEYGVSDTFVKSLAQKIQPGAAAVFALLKDVTLDKVKADLAKLGGTVLYTNLSLDDELKLVEALSKAKETANG